VSERALLPTSVASSQRLSETAAGPCHSAGRPGLRAEGQDSHTALSAFFLSPLCPPQEIPQELTLDALLEMDEAKAKEMLRRWGASTEECSRLQQALTCLRKVTGLGKQCLLCPRVRFCLCSQAWLVPLGDGTSARVDLGIDRGSVLRGFGGSFGVAV
jgi:hypothetical protein